MKRLLMVLNSAFQTRRFPSTRHPIEHECSGIRKDLSKDIQASQQFRRNGAVKKKIQGTCRLCCRPLYLKRFFSGQRPPPGSGTNTSSLHNRNCSLCFLFQSTDFRPPLCCPASLKVLWRIMGFSPEEARLREALATNCKKQKIHHPPT